VKHPEAAAAQTPEEEYELIPNPDFLDVNLLPDFEDDLLPLPEPIKEKKKEEPLSKPPPVPKIEIPEREPTPLARTKVLLLSTYAAAIYLILTRT
jgi:hypothetical protein